MIINRETISEGDIHSEIAGKVCHDRTYGVWLGSGNDSYVKQVGDQVCKVYSGENLAFMTGSRVYEKICRYRDITCQAALMSAQEDWRIDLPIDQNPSPLRVTPFLAIVKCPKTGCENTIGIAPMVEGDSLKQLLAQYDEAKLRRILDAKSIWIKHQLHVTGVSLRPENIKVKMTESGISYVITDLAAVIGVIS